MGSFCGNSVLKNLKGVVCVLDFSALGRVGRRKGAPIVLMMLLHFVGPTKTLLSNPKHAAASSAQSGLLLSYLDYML